MREIETLSLFKKRLKAYYFKFALKMLPLFDASILLLIAVQLVPLGTFGERSILNEQVIAALSTPDARCIKILGSSNEFYWLYMHHVS